MKKQRFFLLLILVTLCQAAFSQPKIDRFEKTILEFETEDRAEGYHPEAILFTGSSSIRMWKTLQQDMTPLPAINRGFGGSTIPEVIHYADRIILPHHPKLLVLYCGENDIAHDDVPAKTAVKSFKKFYAWMQDNLPDTKVFFLPLKPSVSRWKYWEKFQKANKKIKKFIEKKDDWYYIDTASAMLDDNGMVKKDIFIKDNLHMNAKGYAIWTKVVKPVLEKYYED